jgi:hypothetical protein
MEEIQSHYTAATGTMVILEVQNLVGHYDVLTMHAGGVVVAGLTRSTFLTHLSTATRKRNVTEDRRSRHVSFQFYHD